MPWVQPVRYEYTTNGSARFGDPHRESWTTASGTTGSYVVPSMWLTSSSATSGTTLRWGYEGWHPLTYGGAPLTVDNIEPIYEMPGDPPADIRARTEDIRARTESEQRQAQRQREREECHQARVKAQSRAAELLLS